MELTILVRSQERVYVVFLCEDCGAEAWIDTLEIHQAAAMYLHAMHAREEYATLEECECRPIGGPLVGRPSEEGEECRLRINGAGEVTGAEELEAAYGGGAARCLPEERRPRRRRRSKNADRPLSEHLPLSEPGGSRGGRGAGS